MHEPRIEVVASGRQEREPVLESGNRAGPPRRDAIDERKGHDVGRRKQPRDLRVREDASPHDVRILETVRKHRALYPRSIRATPVSAADPDQLRPALTLNPCETFSH